MDGRHIGWDGSAGPEIKSDKQPARWKHRRRSGLAAARSAAPRVSNIHLPSSSSTVVVISVGTALAAGPCEVWVPCEVPAPPGPALAPLLPEHRTSPHPPPNLVGQTKLVQAKPSTGGGKSSGSNYSRALSAARAQRPRVNRSL